MTTSGDGLDKITTRELELMLTEMEQEISTIRDELNRRRAEAVADEYVVASEDMDHIRGSWRDLVVYLRDLMHR